MNADVRKRNKLIWRMVLLTGLAVELIMIAVSVISIAGDEYHFSFWQTIAFVAISIWIYIAYLKQRAIDISKSVVDEKIKTHALIENLRDGIMVLDEENRVLVLNSKAATVLGVPEVDCLGRDILGEFDDVVREALRTGREGEVEGVAVAGGKKVRLQMIRLQTGSEQGECRLVYVRAAGETATTEHVPAPAVGRAAGTARVVTCMTDELLGILATAKPADGRAVAMTKLILRGMAETVELEGLAARNLIRTKSMAGTLTRTVLPVSRLWADLAGALGTVETAAGVKLEFPDVACDRIKVNGDAVLLAAAMKQVLCNALQESIPGGRLVVKVGEMGSAVGVMVLDSGASVAKESAERLYNETYAGLPGMNGATVRAEGTGYYLARGIVEAHGGTMTAESPAEGGLRVMMMLPGG